MSVLGVNTAIFENGNVLLVKREDFEVWCLPGGHVDDHESVAQAAIREVREETGLDVRLMRLVGIYSRPGWNHGGTHIVVFAAEIAGGTLQADPHEVLDVQFFALDALPPLLVGHRQRILDAARGIGGSVAFCESIIYPADQPVDRLELYARRDQSGLPRDAFYEQYFSTIEPDPPGKVEVKGRESE